ncbi:MAG: lipopolysaccharide biosynthesis protein [Lachnospiraceae bacterium]|nr:lipopolysaccharide biosynthesis protein [Lachnospiraceae bacterium]
MESKIATGLFWTFSERIFAQGVSFVVSIILARVMMPSDYGAVSMIMVFISLANVLVANGLGESLIQKKDSNEEDFSTIFFCSIFLSIILYVILFVAAPIISNFYQMDLTWLLRVLALKIPLAAINSIQSAYISKHMIFKKMFWGTSIGTFISGIVGVTLAISGAGSWALVAQYLTNSAIDVIVLWVILPLKIKPCFSYASAKELFPYGMKIMFSSLINTGFTEVRSLVIGKVYTSADLAYYQKGNQFPALVINNVDTAIGKVFFPAMSSVNDEKNRLKEMARTSIRMTSFIIFPIMFGLAAVGENLILVLLTEKWRDSVIFLQLACIFYATQPIQTADWQILKALGRADLCVKLEVLKKTIAIALLAVSAFISVEAVAVCTVITAVISTIINMIPASRLVGYSIRDHIRDICHPLVYSIVMLVVVLLIGKLIENIYISLIVQILTGVLIYIGLSFILKDSTFLQLFNFVKSYLRGRK